ncbi:LysE family translocator [candidate division KSB1 bacterium]|nr:LysE family translocator [candidate division KSB1 bacterium]
MNFDILLAFFLGMIILSATPGPGVLASVSTALSKGFKSSLLFIGGLVIGDIFFFLLAVLGMSVISKIMGQLFYIIKIIGGMYLLYLGLNIIKNRKEKIRFKNGKLSKHKTLLSGLLITLGNPKPILFYAGIVPTIIDINQIHLYEVIAIIFIISLVSFIVIGFYCYLAIISKALILKKKYQNKVNLTSGLVMVAIGSYVLLKKS